MTNSREDAIALGAIGIIDGSGDRTRAGFITNIVSDEYIEAVQADDPIGFWLCDEASGATLANSATKDGGAADDLTLIPGTGGALDASMTHAGVTHKGVDFDYGAGNIAVATEASAWLPQAYPFCLEAVMKWDSETDGVIMRLTMDDEAGSPYYGGGGDAFSTKIYTMSSERIGCISFNETNGAGASMATDVFQDGEVIHVFVRCMEADYVGHANCHLYVNGLYIRSWGYYDVFSGSYGYSQLQVGARYNNSLSVITESNSIIGLAAVYDVDVPGSRVQTHAAALRKHYDLELKGSATAISAFSGSGGYAIESDGTAANHAEIGDPRGDPYSPQSAGSILDDLGRREQTFAQREPDLAGGGTGRTQGRDYTIVVAVSRDSYSDADVILANNSSTTHANTVNDGFWYHGHAFATYRGTNDGIRLEIQADDTVRFTHVNLTCDSSETITNTDTRIIAARFDGSGGPSYEHMSIFVDGEDKQQNTSIYPNEGYNGPTSGGISTFLVSAEEDADGFDCRIGCLMFFPTALSDAEILSLSEKLLDEEGSAPNSPPTGSVTISGTATEDQVLTAANTLADADGLGVISYQWNRGVSAIGGATNTTYTLVQADVGSTITVTASYTDDGGTAESVTSSATSSVANVNDPPGGAVTISGTVTEDQTLTADASGVTDEDGLGAFSYQWKRGDDTIVGATASTYTLVQADVGSTITVTASYTDGQGTPESVTSAATAEVANVNDPPTGSVTISGTPTEDQTLTAANTLADEDGLGVISYQWNRGGVAIVGATASTHILAQADVGSTITVTASYTDGQGTPESVTSSATSSVANVSHALSGDLTIDGRAVESLTLTANTTDLVDADGFGAFAYKWMRNDVDIPGAVAVTYTLTQADVGSTITVEASYTDGEGTAESVTSAATAAVALFVNSFPWGTLGGSSGGAGELSTVGPPADFDDVCRFPWALFLPWGLIPGGSGGGGGGGGGAGGGGPPTLAAGEWAIKFSDVVLCSCTEGTGTSSVKTASGTMPNGTWFVMEHFDDEVWRPAIPPTNPLVLVFYTSTNCTGESYPLGLAENYHIELSDIDGDGVPDSTIELNWTELDGAPNYWFRTGSPVAKPTAGNQIVIPNANTTCAWPGPVQKSMGINGNVTILRGPT